MESRERVDLLWLLRLRWGAAAGHVATILAVHFGIGIPLPLAEMFAIIAVAVATNAALHVAWHRRQTFPSWITGGVLVADVAMLTGILALSGGAANPGVVFFFVHVSLATVVLGSRWRLLVALTTLGCLLLLFATHAPPSALEAEASLPSADGTYLWGLLIFTTVAAAFIFYFGDRLTSALATRDAQVAAARSRQARDEKLASLATLAAGAAHELATPLSTIAMLSKELDRALRDGSVTLDEAAEDARVIRDEVDRCRDVLNLMSAEAGESRGEPNEDVAVETLVSEVLRDLAGRDRITVALGDAASATVNVPIRPTALAFRGIVQNALDATKDAGDVALRARIDGPRVCLEVADGGEGMPREVLRRATEPFFTTKPTGAGMGLGLFLAHDLARRHGGDLRVESAVGQGATVTIRLPLVR